jgi:hypothetical protein
MACQDAAVLPCHDEVLEEQTQKENKTSNLLTNQKPGI